MGRVARVAIRRHLTVTGPEARTKLNGGSAMTSKSNFAVWERVGAVAVLAAFVLLASLCFGQQLTATLSGTTMDSTGAVVPNAKVSLKNESSGDTRSTVSNTSGHFSLTAVQPGTFTVTVSAPGFKAWEQAGVVLSQGDNRERPHINPHGGGTSA